MSRAVHVLQLRIAAVHVLLCCTSCNYAHARAAVHVPLYRRAAATVLLYTCSRAAAAHALFNIMSVVL